MHEPAGKRPGTQALPNNVAFAPTVGSGPGKRSLVEQAFEGGVQRRAGSDAATDPGKRSLVEQAFEGGVQRRAGSDAATDPSTVQSAAAHGIATASSPLPHRDVIQRAFGHHDISGIQAHTGADAAASAGAMGAQAYATGDHVVLGRGPDLHTVAHEAAHVVQQRAGVHLAGGVGRSGDPYEQHADAVADLVVQGKSAEALLDTHAPKGGGSSAPTGAVQHKLEYASHHAIAPEAAKAAVKADHAAYAATADQFEIKLGAGLHNNEPAKQGANAMLRRMQDAMTRAGIDPAGQDAAFGAKAAEVSPDLGVVLIKDVRDALADGNLREKMGMVYRARFKISEALATLRDDATPESQAIVGDELKTPQMGDKIAAARPENGGKGVSHAILERRNSVNNQRRDNGAKQAELSEGQLAADGIGLSPREQAAATPVGGGRNFIPGRQFYAIPADIRKREQDNLRRVAAGLSGSADMYFHIAKHLNMPADERRLLRLASLGQMLANRDHSYHEIMHVAKTQGGLDDYDDELPIGYTKLAPLSGQAILDTAGVDEFPGDAQIRNISTPMDTSAGIASKAAPSPKSKSYPAVLALLSDYEANPSRAKLQDVVTGVEKWINDGPGMMPGAEGKRKFEDRAQHLRQVLAKAKHLLAMGDGLNARPEDQRGALAKDAIDSGTGGFMDRVGDLEGDHANWYSKDFRAQSSDLALDTANISIPADPANLAHDQDLRDDLKTRTADYVGQVRWDLEGINGTLLPPVRPSAAAKVKPGDGRGVPDLKDSTGLAARAKNTDMRTAYDDPRYKREPEDFQNFDASDLQALAPDAPLGGALKRFEGKAVPAELEALNAYTQAGFYVMMNHVLNRRFRMSKTNPSAADQAWWAGVPDQTKKLISLAISGVRKMTPYTGPLYRGENLVRGVAAQLSKPKAARQAHWSSAIPLGTKTYNQFVSTSKRPHSSYIMEAGKYTAGHFVNSKTGVDISALGGKLYEREVVFAPGTTFRVTQVEDRFNSAGGTANDRYGSRADEASPPSSDDGRIRVTFEEV